MDADTIIKLFILVLLLILSAFFSSSETALTTVNLIRIKTLMEEGNKKAVTVHYLLSHRSKMLSAILIGNNVVNLTASALATTIALELFGSIYVSVATGILTFLVLIFGEIIPKTSAMANAEKNALAIGGIIKAFMIVLTPFIYIIDLISGFVLRLMGIDKEKRAALTEQDIRSIMDVGQKDGAIEEEELELIENVFDLSDSVAKDIMIPRNHMTCIDADASYAQLMKLFRETMYTRFPVYENDDKDHIIGIVNVKDLLLMRNNKDFTVRKLLRNVSFTYEMKSTADLMPQMREKGETLCIVLDEYGVTAGMITLEDLLEEIVGEIHDEYDKDEEERIRQLSEKSFSIEGALSLDDVNDALHTTYECEEFDSIGGLLILHLEKLPMEHDKVVLEDGTILEAMKVSKHCIERVLLTLPEDSDAEGDETDAAIS